MKKFYKTPDMVIMYLDAEDIIACSGDDYIGEEGNGDAGAKSRFFSSDSDDNWGLTFDKN